MFPANQEKLNKMISLFPLVKSSNEINKRKKLLLLLSAQSLNLWKLNTNKKSMSSSRNKKNLQSKNIIVVINDTKLKWEEVNKSFNLKVFQNEQ